MTFRNHPYALLVGAAASWGIGTVLSKQALGEFSPLPLLVVQLSGSTILLLAACLLSKQRFVWDRNLGKVAALGVLNPGLAYALGLIGLTYITASTYVLLWAMEPVLITALAIAMLGERPARTVYLTMTTAVLGALLIVFQPGVGGTLFGVSITLISVGLCALYTVFARAFSIDETAIVATLAQQIAALTFAVVLTLGVGVISDGGLSLEGISGSSWLLAVLSGLLYYALGFSLYLGGLKHVAAALAGVFLTLIPVFGIAGAMVVGERLEPRQWVGAIIVVVSVGLLMRSLALTTKLDAQT